MYCRIKCKIKIRRIGQVGCRMCSWCSTVLIKLNKVYLFRYYRLYYFSTSWRVESNLLSRVCVYFYVFLWRINDLRTLYFKMSEEATAQHIEAWCGVDRQI